MWFAGGEDTVPWTDQAFVCIQPYAANEILR
ncbi:hypothetical protein XA1311A_11000 [Xanthomonas arboricola]|nr:hypothetical protein XA1311A_11000 [Xanthomonas arboricola]CAE6727852.1 hypothetical protein XA1311A_11000 [Xanthomonas arboricola]